eukprot:gene3680-4027_t
MEGEDSDDGEDLLPILVEPKAASKLSREDVISALSTGEPLLVKGCFAVDNEKWCHKMVGALREEAIQYDSRSSSSGKIDTFECSFEEFIASLSGNSDHEESMYFMSEAVLQTKCADLLQPLQLPLDIFEDNLFSLFPENIRPKNALIIGGSGARSFMHRDPYDWTGWNYLFEGRKLWVFFPPDQEEFFLEPYQHEPDAWEMDQYQIAMGFVSEADVFRNRLPSTLRSLEKEISQLPRLSRFRRLSKLSPVNAKALEAFQSGSSVVKKRYGDIPLFSSGFGDMDSTSDKSWAKGLQLIVQEEGETVFVPPTRWHQVYHLEPSIALASQHCCSFNEPILYDHILTCCCPTDIKASKLKEVLSLTDKKERLHKVLRIALESRYGISQGNSRYQALLK